MGDFIPVIDHAIRLLFLSAGPARNTTSGGLLIHRHFSLLSRRFEVHCAHEAPPLPDERNYIQLPRRRLFQRLLRTRFNNVVRGLDYGYGAFYSRSVLRALVRKIKPAAIITITEASLYMPTRAVAISERIPLISIFHDWSPGWPEIPTWGRSSAERSFRRTYRDSAYAFCVSQELHAELGDRPNSAVLLPIPASEKPAEVSQPAKEFSVLYAGVFNILYAAEMKLLCQHLVRTGETRRLTVIGPDPGWPNEDAQCLHQSGVYQGFHKGPEFHQWLARAPAFLVISPFGREFEWYARYSFPSKIPECCRYGKPMLIWGPPYAASVRWARRTGAAEVVDDPSPVALLASIERLANSPEERTRLASRAKDVSRTDFNPANLQRVFEAGLNAAIGASQLDMAGSATAIAARP